MQELGAAAGAPERVAGMKCNVARPDEVAAFADFAAQALGGVDLWIK